MSNRVEWALADAVTVELVPRGTEFHGYEEPVTARIMASISISAVPVS